LADRLADDDPSDPASPSPKVIFHPNQFKPSEFGFFDDFRLTLARQNLIPFFEKTFIF